MQPQQLYRWLKHCIVSWCLIFFKEIWCSTEYEHNYITSFSNFDLNIILSKNIPFYLPEIISATVNYDKIMIISIYYSYLTCKHARFV